MYGNESSDGVSKDENYKHKLLNVVICILQYADRTWPVLIIGALMFIPGAYHVRIAYYAYKGYDGYSYDDIPEFD